MSNPSTKRRGLIYVLTMTALTWLITLLAAFASRGLEAVATLCIAILYSVLRPFRDHVAIRAVLIILVVLVTVCMLLLLYEIVLAYNAAPKA